MKFVSRLFPIMLCYLLLYGCRNHDPTPIDQLPKATQEGKNTIGCLLNGQAWTPKGNDGTSNYRVSFDPTFDGGTFDLRTYRYYGTTDEEVQDIILYTNNLSTIGTYPFSNHLRSRVTFIESKAKCDYESYDSLTTYSNGTLTINRLDLSKGIIAGTFEFTLAKAGCDTIKVTNGRFDKQL